MGERAAQNDVFAGQFYRRSGDSCFWVGSLQMFMCMVARGLHRLRYMLVALRHLVDFVYADLEAVM